MTPQEIRIALKDRNLSEVARRCDLAIGTIWSLANCPEKDDYVRFSTLKTVSDYLEANP